jgi:methylmalonyl-CoA mutase
MMESLTNELGDKALEIIKEVESMGGMTKYISSGIAKLRIEECATRKQARIDSGQEVVIGVNKYRLEDESSDAVDVRQIDNSKVRSGQIARLEELKASRDEKMAQAALDRLLASAELDRSTSNGDDPDNLLALSIECARNHCTLGEISMTLEKAWGRHVAKTSVVQGAYISSFTALGGGNEEYEQLLQRVQDFEKKEGRRPRILVAKMGQDGHDRGAKVIASGFSDFGFDVDVGPLFQTPEEVAVQALDSDVHVIGISSQAAGHRTLMPALKKELEDKGMGNVVVVAGGVIPSVDYDFLMNETQSCSAVFGPGTRVLDAANKVLDLIKSK